MSMNCVPNKNETRPYYFLDFIEITTFYLLRENSFLVILAVYTYRIENHSCCVYMFVGFASLNWNKCVSESPPNYLSEPEMYIFLETRIIELVIPHFTNT